MSHLQEEQLVDVYYGDSDPELRGHLEACEECRSNFERLEELLNSAKDYPVPERSESYGREVWARLLPKLSARPRTRWFRWWTMAPVFAALLVAVFVAGMLTQRERERAVLDKARERVLLIAMSDHLERSQIMLTELLNTAPAAVDFSDERERARDLLEANRLLRQSALNAGDTPHAALLDDLERVLLSVANSPSEVQPGELEALQRRIENEGLLFKVRITSVDARTKGQKL